MPTSHFVLEAGGPFLVGVTGGGLYNSGLDYNSSAVLKDALPDYIHRAGKPDIKILKAIENIPSEYAASRKLIHDLWSGNMSLYDSKTQSTAKVEVHLMVHMGMWVRQQSYCLESVARRDGYIHPDHRGNLPDLKDYDAGGFFDGCPAEMKPDLDIEAAVQAVQSTLPGHKMRVSVDAGHNLCEWFYYTSMAEAFKRKVPRNVAFVHVPAGRSNEEIKVGTEIWEEYVSALVDQIIEGRKG